MIIPSIDLMDANAVQLVEGREKVLDAGDPRPIADKFGLVGEIAVIDLDAALAKGDNRDAILDLCKRARCRVGGGIRDVESAIAWLDAGASKVILGTAATPQILQELPRERVIAALDSRNDKVVVEGWTKQTTRTVEERIEELAEHVGGFLVTFVEGEGRMGGFDAERIQRIVERAGDRRVTVAGGVRCPEDIDLADELGADAQVGMALYKGVFDLAKGFCAPLRSDRPDGLWPTIVADERGVALGLAYSNLESVREAIDSRRGVYHSRSRNELWIKGESSANTQELLAIGADCDRDTLRFTVRQQGSGFCHKNTRTCFADDPGMGALERIIQTRLEQAPLGSYTRRLLDESGLLGQKLLEEAQELDKATTPSDAAWELADVLYFALVAAARKGATLANAEELLEARALKVTRRLGNAKPRGESS